MILTEYTRKKFIKLKRMEQVVYYHIETCEDFPLFIPDVCRTLKISRSSFTSILKSLLKYDLVDVIEYQNYKEIYKKGYLEANLET